jgi:hypothetical protein
MPTTGIASIKQTLDAAQKTFTEWAKEAWATVTATLKT